MQALSDLDPFKLGYEASKATTDLMALIEANDKPIPPRDGLMGIEKDELKALVEGEFRKQVAATMYKELDLKAANARIAELEGGGAGRGGAERISELEGLLVKQKVLFDRAARRAESAREEYRGALDRAFELVFAAGKSLVNAEVKGGEDKAKRFEQAISSIKASLEEMGL